MVKKFVSSEAATIRNANPRMRKWSDAKVLRVANREAKRQDKKIKKEMAKKARIARTGNAKKRRR